MTEHSFQIMQRTTEESESQVFGHASWTALALFCKRAFDILVSLGCLVWLSPACLFIALLIKLDSPGPIFYRGRRIGKDGKPFWMIKFRTMEHVPVDTGPRVTTHDDGRITHLGHILRDTKLNELPQLLNVLKGDMSLVGPRPEDPKYVALYTPKQRWVLSVTPGITSVASVFYRDEEKLLNQGTLEDVYVNAIMPDKLQLDLEYIGHRSFLVDLDILARTCHVILPRLAQVAPDIDELFFGPVQRFVRRYLSWFTLDLTLGLGAVLMTYLIWWRASGSPELGWPSSAVVALVLALVFTVMNQIWGLHHSMWAYASGQEVVDILLSTSFATGLLLVINALVRGLAPEEVLLSGFFAFVAFAAARYRSRLIAGVLWRWRDLRNVTPEQVRTRLLIVGTDGTGEFLARQLRRRRANQGYQVVGFVDDDLTKRGMRIHGVQVLGTCRMIPSLIDQHHIDMVIVTGQPLSQYQVLADVCRGKLIQVKMIPDIVQLVCGLDPMVVGQTESEAIHMKDIA